jgi:hypothetical protein
METARCKRRLSGPMARPMAALFGQIATAWPDWQLRGDATAARMFKGSDRTLCAAASWHITNKSID